jgi:hypothetical protein
MTANTTHHELRNGHLVLGAKSFEAVDVLEVVRVIVLDHDLSKAMN